MGFRTVCVIAAMMMFATACEHEFEDASGDIGNGAVGDPTAPPDTAPDNGDPTAPPDTAPDIGDGSAPGEGSTVTTLPPSSDDGASTPAVTLMYAERGDDGEGGPLDGAAVDGPFDAHLLIDDLSIDPDRVTWLIDGEVFRDDDLDAPYTIRYNGHELPLDRSFASDQTLGGSWRLDRGTIHEITAIIEQPGDDLAMSATFAVGDPGSDPSTGEGPSPTTSAPAPTQPPSTTSTPPSSTLPPPSDGWPVPGPVAGRRTITGNGNWVIDYRDSGTPWHIHDVDIVADGGHAVGPSGAEGGGVMENASVVVDGGDNIKIATDGVYRNLYLRMASNGGHLDAMQSQGNSGWVIDNVVIEIPTPSSSVTGAIIIENLRGGGAGYRDVVGTINRLKLIGTGPYHHDIRLQNNAAATMTVTVTNVDWSQAHPDSVLLLTGTPATLTVYVDDSVPDDRIKGAANATVIRI